MSLGNPVGLTRGYSFVHGRRLDLQSGAFWRSNSLCLLAKFTICSKNSSAAVAPVGLLG